ncbi:MAG: hypothetical protein JNM56_36115 [Planctomycetia bacterium]|nr:hypothetical protein [Planctomycetia bacterium]
MMQRQDDDRYEPTFEDQAADAELDRLFADTVAPEPSEAAWRRLQERIDRQAAPTLAGLRRRASRRPLYFARLLVPVAAAVLLAAVWFRSVPNPPTPATEHADVFPMAAADDVEIVSMEGGDYSALVVGKPPLSEPMVLVAHGDATEIHVRPDVDGMVPTVAKLADGLATTMIVAPLLTSGEEGK